MDGLIRVNGAFTGLGWSTDGRFIYCAECASLILADRGCRDPELVCLSCGARWWSARGARRQRRRGYRAFNPALSETAADMLLLRARAEAFFAEPEPEPVQLAMF